MGIDAGLPGVLTTRPQPSVICAGSVAPASQTESMAIGKIGQSRPAEPAIQRPNHRPEGANADRRAAIGRDVNKIQIAIVATASRQLADHRFDFLAQHGGGEWLDDVVVHAGLRRRHDQRVVATTRHQDERKLANRRMTTHRPQ